MKSYQLLILINILVGLSGCSYVQSLFPDKERDYQYTTEIPLINYPAELRKNQTEAAGSLASSVDAPAASVTGSNENSSLESNTEKSELDNSQENPPEPQPVPDSKASNTQVITADESERDTVSSVEVIKYDDGESRLRLGSGFSKSWRVVNKALSRNTIEVTERNSDKAHIKIQYDPDEKKAKDGSLLDEIAFIFKGIDTNDREFVLKIEELGDKTDVIVLNEEHLPMLNDEGALRLLKMLADTIKADLASKAK
jgi:outer membrane protein assembly factor BamC